MAPEEGEAVQVHIALHGEPLQPPVDQSQVSIVIMLTNHRSVLPEEGLAEVKRLLAPQHLVPQQQSEQ